MIVTDSNLLEAGIKDFIFVCKRQPFAITCSPYLPKIPESYVDLDLVMKLNIPMKNLQCTRLTYAGQFTRIVGQIRQTVQCVVAGKAIGTTHLKAKVVRDLNKLFHADCIASQQLYNQLMDPANPCIDATIEPKTRAYKRNTSNLKGNSDIYTNISTVVANNDVVNSNCSQEEDNESVSDTDHASGESFVNEEFFLRQQELQQKNWSISRSMADLLEDAKDDHYDMDLGYYGAIMDSKGIALTKDYDIRPEHSKARSSLDPEPCPTQPDTQPSLRAPPDIPPDPVLAAIASKGLGPTDLHIMSLNAHPMDTSPAQAVTSVREPHASALSYPSPYASDLEYDDSNLARLMAQHGYRAHDVTSDRDEDRNSLHSDTAEFFCRLCSVSNQPDIVTFGHNLLDPSCPSMEEDVAMARDTDSDGTIDEEEDDLEE